MIGIFGLNPRTREEDLRSEFEKYGDLENVTIIYDRRTGESKRFGFVYFKNQEDAIKAKEGLTGLVNDSFLTHSKRTGSPWKRSEN